MLLDRSSQETFVSQKIVNELKLKLIPINKYGSLWIFRPPCWKYEAQIILDESLFNDFQQQQND